MPRWLEAQPSPPQEQAPKLEPVKQSITVTDTISTDAPASITVVGQEKIEGTPGVDLDDRLRDVPGFSLFRRSSSLVVIRAGAARITSDFR